MVSLCKLFDGDVSFVSDLHGKEKKVRKKKEKKKKKKKKKKKGKTERKRN